MTTITEQADAVLTPCKHGELATNEHTCADHDLDDCFICACCGNCREDVDSHELCSGCEGVDENAGEPELAVA